MRRPLALAVTLLLAGCVAMPTEDGLTYAPPQSRPAEAALAIPGTDRAEAVAGIAARLRAAGFRIETASARTGTVVARSVGPGFVNCGTFTQMARGNVTRFAAHAPRAALFDPAEPGTILLRQVTARTQVKVEVGTAQPATARLSALYGVRVSQSPATSPGKGWREERKFALGPSARFSDQVTCVGNGRLADIVSGR